MEEFDAVYNSFYDNFNKEEMVAELSTLYVLYCSAVAEVPSVNIIKTELLTMSTAQRMLLYNVCGLCQLLLILLATNTTSERSYGVLHLIESYTCTSKAPCPRHGSII